MNQPALFVESLNGALRDAIRACGGAKVVACQLWPEKSPEAAARLLADCLNEHRAERLTPDQLLLVARLGRDRGCHVVMEYMASQLGYGAPVPIEHRWRSTLWPALKMLPGYRVTVRRVNIEILGSDARTRVANFRPYMPPRWSVPRAGSDVASRLPSVCGGQLVYPRGLQA